MKTYPRLIALLRETMNLTTGEAEALTRGIEAEAVVRLGGRSNAVRRALRLRHNLANVRVLKKHPLAKDRTLYCLDSGYTGKRRVYLIDGIVVSHGNLDWHLFCSRFGCSSSQSAA